MDESLPYRLLCQINENLHHAVNDLRTLCVRISVPGDRLDRMVTMIEESRAVMNRTLAECIEMRESARAGELGRARREQEGRASIPLGPRVQVSSRHDSPERAESTEPRP